MATIPLDRLNVLIVDDNAQMRNLVSGILRALGVRDIYSAANVSQAYRELTLNPIDVAFVDWEMPPDSGLDFVIKVRTAGDSPNPYVPIIMLTGHSDKAHVIAARNAGVHEFLAKPVSARSIYERLLSVLNSPRPFVRIDGYFGPEPRWRRDTGFEGKDRRKAAREAEADAAVSASPKSAAPDRRKAKAAAPSAGSGVS